MIGDGGSAPEAHVHLHSGAGFRLHRNVDDPPPTGAVAARWRRC